MGGDASTNRGGRAHKGGRKGTGVGFLRLEHPVNLLFEQEFQARFRIPDKIAILLVDGEPLSSENSPTTRRTSARSNLIQGSVYLYPLFEQFLHFTQIPLAFLHPNVVRVLMWCSILDMFY